MNNSQENKVALVTGGTSGIGRAAAQKLAKLGIHVIVTGRNAERGQKTVQEIRSTGGKADFIALDLRHGASAREVAGNAIRLGNGHVDILINSAGMFPFGLTHEMTEATFDRVYSLNVKCRTSSLRNLLRLWRKEAKARSSMYPRWSRSTACRG